MNTDTALQEPGEPQGLREGRKAFIDWFTSQKPFDENVGAVELGIQRAAAWLGWKARVAHEARKAKPAEASGDSLGETHASGRLRLCELMAEHDFTLPIRAFEELTVALTPAPAALASGELPPMGALIAEIDYWLAPPTPAERKKDLPVKDRSERLHVLLRDCRSLAAREPAPIDMVLHCPVCGLQHVDAEDEPPTPGREHWTNPPHRSHLCHGCGHIWRPADVPTNGVAAVKTKGKADPPIAEREAVQSEHPPGAPEAIWLQLYGDASPNDAPVPNVETDEITWCWHQINEHDVKYVLATAKGTAP